MPNSGELDLVGGQLTVSKASELLTSSLERALLEAPNTAAFVETVRKDRALYSAVQKIAPQMAKKTAPMDEATVYVCLQPLIVIYGPPRFADTAEGQAMAQMWLKVYTEALKGMPVEALEHAVSEYIRSGPPKFRQKAWNFPEPSDLVGYAKPVAQKVMGMAWRIKAAAEAPPFVDRDSEEFRAEQADLKRQWAEEGLLRPDGTFDAAKLFAAKRAPGAARPAESQADAAARIRRQASIA